MANDSITKFANVLFSEALCEKEKIARELEEEKNNILKKKDSELKEKFEKETERYRAELEYEIKVSLSKRENELAGILRQNRSKTADEVFEKAREELKAFTKTPEYKEYLERELTSVASEFGSGETVCVASRDDFESIKELSSIPNMKYEEAEASIIGGFTLRNDEAGKYADCTLKSKLAEQEELFFKISGLIIE